MAQEGARAVRNSVNTGPSYPPKPPFGRTTLLLVPRASQRRKDENARGGRLRTKRAAAAGESLPSTEHSPSGSRLIAARGSCRLDGGGGCWGSATPGGPAGAASSRWAHAIRGTATRLALLSLRRPGPQCQPPADRRSLLILGMRLAARHWFDPGPGPSAIDGKVWGQCIGAWVGIGQECAPAALLGWTLGEAGEWTLGVLFLAPSILE